MILLEEMLKAAEEKDAYIELFSVAGKDIRGCDGCYACQVNGECHIQDDMQVLYEKMIEADGIVFGTPIYYYGMIAQAKSIIDRTFALSKPERRLVNKVGGVIVVAGSVGIIDALKDYYFYISMQRMLPANCVAAYASKKGEVKQHEKAMNAAYQLGLEIVELVNKKFEFPKQFPHNFFAFNMHPY